MTGQVLSHMWMTLVIALSVVVPVVAAWDFGRRWLKQQDYEKDLRALKDIVEQNRVRSDKAISNLASQTQETVHELEKKCNSILSGNMLRPGGTRRIG